MALGSVAISGGMSKKTKERLMYMDGKLVWSAVMGASSGMSTTAPAEVDYIVVKPMALLLQILALTRSKKRHGLPEEAQVMYRGCNIQGTTVR